MNGNGKEWINGKVRRWAIIKYLESQLSNSTEVEGSQGTERTGSTAKERGTGQGRASWEEKSSLIGSEKTNKPGFFWVGRTRQVDVSFAHDYSQTAYSREERPKIYFMYASLNRWIIWMPASCSPRKENSLCEATRSVLPVLNWGLPKWMHWTSVLCHFSPITPAFLYDTLHYSLFIHVNVSPIKFLLHPFENYNPSMFILGLREKGQSHLL